MADDFNTQVLIEIRDSIRNLGDRLDGRIDETNQRLDETNQRLAVLATLTRSIDGRLEKIEEREPNRAFLPHRVSALEDARDDHEARLAALESDR